MNQPISQPQLRRRLGTADAVALGMGSMIGAGAFIVFAPAAAAAGTGPVLLAALAVAALVAFCNATSTAQLAAAYPTAGGAYTYGRERLGPWSGFAAGWSFVIGKTASCAAMCLVFAAYVVPESGALQRGIAAAAVTLLAGINILGIQRTARATMLLLVVSLAGLVLAIVAGLSADSAPLFPDAAAASPTAAEQTTWYGAAQAAGLLFFAFAGYARLATLGEEVRDPRRTIPRAILIALIATAALYAALAVALLRGLGAQGLAESTAPVLDLVRVSGWGWADPMVVIAAATASLGALLALLAGIGRTSFAMARAGDLPSPLRTVGDHTGTPWVAEATVGVAVIALVLTTDLRGAIGFSSFGVLLYYAIAHAAAFTQRPPDRRYPRALQVIGLTLCLALVAAVPVGSIVGGVIVLAIGLFGRFSVIRLLARRTNRPGDRAGGR